MLIWEPFGVSQSESRGIGCHQALRQPDSLDGTVGSTMRFMRGDRQIQRLLSACLVVAVCGGWGRTEAAPILSAGLATVEWWAHLDRLIERQAYPAVVGELQRMRDRATSGDEQSDRVAYYLGIAQRRSGLLKEALQSLSQVPGTSRWYVAALMETALLARESGEDVKAIEIYERLRTLTGLGQQPAILANLADLYFVTGQFSKALTHYRELSNEGGPYQERALFAWGWTLLRMGQEEAAINVWKQALERFTRSRHAQGVRLGLGNLMLARGEHLAASTYYNEAARGGGGEGSKPDLSLMSRAELLAGEAYADSRDYRLAISHYRAVPDDDALAEPAGYGEAFSTWQLGDLKQAQKLFAVWIERFPQSQYRGAAYYAMGAIARDLGQAERAVTDWQMVTSVAPASLYAEDARYQLILHAFRNGQHAEAISMGRQLEFNHPQGRWLGPVLWVRGESYVALGLFEEAVQAYSQLANMGRQAFLAGQRDDIEFRIGMAYFYGGNYGQAARRFAVIERGALAAQALFWQAEARYRLGELDTARALYATLIAKHGDFARVPEAYYGLGWAAYRLNDLEGARSAFGEATRRLGDGRTRQDASFRLGLVLADMRDWSGARDVFNSLLKSVLPPDLATEARFQICWGLYRQGRLEEAAGSFAAFAANHPGDRLAPQALIWQGRSLFRLNRYAECVASLRQAVAHPLVSAPQINEAKEQLAAAHFNNGQYEEARRVYEQLLEVADLPTERTEALHQGIVNTHLKSGNYRAARQTLVRRETLSQEDVQTLLAITDHFVNRAQWDDVVETCRLIKSPPQTLKLAAGRALNEKRAYAEAVRMLGDMRDVSDQELRPKVWHELSRAYRGAGDVTRARALLLQLAELYPTQPLAWQALLEAAELSLAQGDHAVAHGYYRRVAENRAVALDTRRLAWMGLGDSQRQMKQWGQALLAYRAAKGLGGAELLGQAMAGYSAGCVLIELKQYKEAINELRGLRFPPQAEPLPSLALLKLGECYEQMNRWREAVPIYTRLTRVAPERERGEARERLNWIEQNIPKEMRS